MFGFITTDRLDSIAADHDNCVKLALGEADFCEIGDVLAKVVFMSFFPRIFSVTISTTLVVAACSPAGDQLGSTAEQMSSTAADVNAIEAVIQGYADSVNAGDLYAWLTLFTDDAVLMSPNEMTVEGKSKIEAWAQPYFENFVMHETIKTREVVAADDWAFATLDVTFEVTPRAGGDAAFQDIKAILVFRQQSDSSWKVARGIWNTNPPPPVE